MYALTCYMHAPQLPITCDDLITGNSEDSEQIARWPAIQGVGLEIGNLESLAMIHLRECKRNQDFPLKYLKESDKVDF